MLRALCLFYFVLHNTKEISGLSESENLFNAVLYCILSLYILCKKIIFIAPKIFFSAHFPFFFGYLSYMYLCDTATNFGHQMLTLKSVQLDWLTNQVRKSAVYFSWRFKTQHLKLLPLTPHYQLSHLANGVNLFTPMISLAILLSSENLVLDQQLINPLMNFCALSCYSLFSSLAYLSMYRHCMEKFFFGHLWEWKA